MSIAITCGCGKNLKVADEFAGRKGKCPACRQAILIPAPATEVAEAVEAVDDVPPRTGLDGLSPDYSISLTEWERLARPHYGRLLGPAIGYYFVFAGILTVVILLHFLFIGFILDPIVTPALAIGFHVACQALLKGEPFSFGTFFTGFRWIWPLAGRAVLLLVIPAVCMLPTLIVFVVMGLAFGESPREQEQRERGFKQKRMDWAEQRKVAADTGTMPDEPMPEPRWEGPAAAPPAVSIIAFVLLLANAGAAVYVWLRLGFFSHFLIIDRNCGAIESLKGSWLLSRGHFWGLLGTLLLVLFLVYLSGLLTLGIGMLFTLPRAILVLNAGYLKIAGSRPPVAVAAT
ncbi:MAG: hypothetical protein ACJ8F7_22425 [Gemmataceae bacterium]